MPSDQHRTVPDGLSEGPSGTTPPPFSQLLQLKRQGPEPLYYQLAQSLEHALEIGVIGHGIRLLPERVMARELKVTIGTVRSAWAYLERKGILIRQRQAGTFIR
ncbi:GntR family transcriptional regulator [Arthrobacter sp. M4]|uniref:GntR family transcriptional regulator n=1 Tax=Arthrobacter sp. M4 TaxID=218160 RepID=UPI001CDC5C8C|nr:GntR family transcriptional regulator [Arthrobacter sp. M4]MCA4134798.1 GntR family transcriptional regulator [Arthrobacter sp. M4]